MALITGGLGGLGVLASYELASSGHGFIVTTSRSGRIAGGQRELVQLQENMRQMCTHYSARVDGADTGALNDLFQWMQRPETQTEEMDLFASCMTQLEKNPDLVNPDDIKKLYATRDHIAETGTILEKELTERKGTSRDQWWLKEIRKREAYMTEALGRLTQKSDGAPGQQEIVPVAKADRPTTLREYLSAKEESPGSLLERVEKELAAAGLQPGR